MSPVALVFGTDWSNLRTDVQSFSSDNHLNRLAEETMSPALTFDVVMSLNSSSSSEKYTLAAFSSSLPSNGGRYELDIRYFADFLMIADLLGSILQILIGLVLVIPADNSISQSESACETHERLGPLCDINRKEYDTTFVIGD